MNTIQLNGADADEVANKIGGTLIMVNITDIMVNITDDTAMIAGGDLTKLEVA